MKTSTFRNWRKHETNSKEKRLSTAFPVSVTDGGNGCIDIKFENENGERISFSLDKHDSNLMLMQIDKNILKKQVNREDYDMDNLKKLQYENRKQSKN